MGEPRIEDLKMVAAGLRFQLWRLRDSLRDRARGRAHRQGIFERIHNQNLWGDPESVSGGGSGTAATEAIRRELPSLFARYEIRSVLDAPCGDFYWMKDVAASLDRYIGVDIVPELVERNAERHASDKVSFICADIAADRLPMADLVLCRDCFIHLPTRLIWSALENFRASGARYLLLTSNQDVDSYHDIPIGSFRPVNFAQPPFRFPTPLCALNEDGTGTRQLSLWELPSLPIESDKARV